MLEIFGGSLACQHHIPGVPSKLVFPRIVFTLGGQQSSTIGGKGTDLLPLSFSLMDDFQGRHVVNSWIKPTFVEKK